MSATVFWMSVAAAAYVYIGYPAVLLALSLMFQKERGVGNIPGVTLISVLVPAYNEGRHIGRRIENLLSADYPRDRLEIIIASDGSTDDTVKEAKKYGAVKVLDFPENRGRAAVQNDGVREAKGEIIVFSDARTMFEKDFFRKLLPYFSDGRTGCVVGNLIYRTEGTVVSEAEGFYWKQEKKLRALESGLGFLATGTGACMAARKAIWRDLRLTDDCDFITPLDAVLQGYKVVYAPDALAYDVPASSAKGEISTRVRQTSKNLVGTLKRWGCYNWIRHPVISWGLLSHKILRWFTPFFMLAALMGNLFLLDSGKVYLAFFVAQALFYLIAFVGLVGQLLSVRVPLASTVFGFCLANIAIGIGVVKGFIGKAPAVYKTTE